MSEVKFLIGKCSAFFWSQSIIILMKIRGFLFDCFPGFFRYYYLRKYKEDILDLLLYYQKNDSEEKMLTMEAAYTNMHTDKNWTIERFTKIFMICVFLKYIAPHSKYTNA